MSKFLAYSSKSSESRLRLRSSLRLTNGEVWKGEELLEPREGDFSLRGVRASSYWLLDCLLPD